MKIQTSDLKSERQWLRAATELKKEILQTIIWI